MTLVKKDMFRFFIGLIAGLMFLLPQKITAQSIHVHDPVMIRQDGEYYVFCTGYDISVWSSPDMKTWKHEAPVFSRAPDWTFKTVPGFRGFMWAPDISYHNHKFYLYYAVSAFGKNTSCIGVATNKTLKSSDPGFHWEDHGIVVQSVPNRDLWNAIDPNLVIDENNQGWLVFGSFWEGIKMVKLDSSLLKVANPQVWYTLAKRERDFTTPDTDPGSAAIEAPFIFKKNGYYYLFVSYDYCCRGVNSNYKIMVGRSKTVTGPYVDRTGKDMTKGGASLVLAGNDKWPGVGHNAAYTFDGTDYIIFHAYDASDHGISKLKICKIIWDSDKWPTIGPNW